MEPLPHPSAATRFVNASVREVWERFNRFMVSSTRHVMTSRQRGRLRVPRCRDEPSRWPPLAAMVTRGGPARSVQPPPHASVLATLDELRANPTCSGELPAVLDALSAFRFESSTARPQIVTAACDDSFRVEIQNELVRFGAGCERASATAFVPVLCQGSSTWSDPFVLSFVLRKSGDNRVITEGVELEPDR